MEKELNISEVYNRDIEEYNRFSSMLSKSVHDINNPLAVFIGQISIIELLQKRGKLDEEKMVKIIEKFKSSSETLKERINLLRNFYKVLINDPHFPTVENAIMSACYQFENDAYQDGVTINYDLVSELESEVPSNQIFLVVKHLMQNSLEAIKASKSDGGEIKVSSKKDGESLQVSISDSGTGLMCDLPMAMELGYTTKATKTGGTGLALISKVLKEHKLELAYSRNSETEFSFHLPLKEMAKEE